MTDRLTVPFAAPARAIAAQRAELEAAAGRVMDSGWLLLGGEGRAFEEEFAAWVGTGHAAGVANGTDAIELALRALELAPGDEVITQANTCVPTVAAIERAGATPVLCDADPASGRVDVVSMAAAVTGRTRALVPVHLYGQCADMDAVLALGLPVVEDCAQAHGASYRGGRAGTLGALAAFSFYPTKNLGALGDGGAVVTSDAALDERLRLLRQYGQADRYEHVIRGVNSRLDELQAAFLRVRLTVLDEGLARRRAIAAHYDEALAGAPVTPLARGDDSEHGFHLYVVRADDREAFRSALEAAGVATLIHYPRPIHGHEPYRALGEGRSLEGAEELAASVVSLPLYPELSDAEVEHVAQAAAAAAHAAA
jgi:dTDP-4-amino-4,6-dideoxygalactose transaminase